MDRVPHRGQPHRAPRPRPAPAHRDRGRAGRPDPRHPGGPARRHGRVPDAGHPGRPAARRVHVQRHLQDGRLRLHLHGRLHHQDADRRLPRRGPPGGDVRASSGPWTSSPHELGIDPIELRRRNWIKHEEFPYTTIAGLTYDSGNYEAATEKALALFGYDKLRAEQADRRERKDPVQLGIGVSTYTEMCGLAPSRVLGSLSYGAGGWEHADGAGAAHRQGRGGHRHQPARAGPRDRVEPDRRRRARRAVRGRHRDPRRHRVLAQGHGHLRLALAGGRRHRGRPGLREGEGEGAGRSRRTCSRRRPDDIEFDRGVFRVRGTRLGQDHPGDRARHVRRAQPARRRRAAARRRAPRSTRRTSPSRTAPTCARSRWTPRPARSKIRSYVAVDDVGKVVNPLIVEGQVHGGIAQGIGQALFEEAVYDAEGNLLTTTMADYLLPSAADLPDFVTDRTETPATSNPLGVKGVGEAGTIASTPAVVNAIVDALRPYGVHDVRDAVHARTGLAGRPGRGRLMIPAPFDYVRPGSLDEAVTALADARRGRQGPRRRASRCCRCCGCGSPTPSTLVDVGRLPELRGRARRGRPRVHRRDDHARRGAALRRGRAECPLVALATATVADPAVRHRGTFGGVARPRRPGRGPARGRARAGLRMVARSRRRRAGDPGGRVLRRLPGDGARPRRDPRRRPGARSSARAGASTTRSSTAPPRRGRSSAWPRRSGGRTARSRRPGSG